MEHEFHHWLHKELSGQKLAFPFLVAGVGDDAAVIDANQLSNWGGSGTAEIIVSTDMIAEGTHFLLAAPDQELSIIGRKLAAVNLSDIAAMGAKPAFMTVNFQLNRKLNFEQATQLFNGLKTMSDEYNVAIVGGDTNTWDGPTVLSATIVGVRNPNIHRSFGGWRLSDAQIGDWIIASGAFGGSIHGRHLTFEPRVCLSLFLAEHYQVNAATDATDSLAIDLNAIARESNVQMQIELDSIPISNDVNLYLESNSAPEDDNNLQHALYDGEDFELLITVPPKIGKKILADTNLPTPMTKIGTVVEGAPRLIDNHGQEIQVKGYVH